MMLRFSFFFLFFFFAPCRLIETHEIAWQCKTVDLMTLMLLAMIPNHTSSDGIQGVWLDY